MGWRRLLFLSAACALTLAAFASNAGAQEPAAPKLIFPLSAGQTWRITCGYALPEGVEHDACGHSDGQWNRYALDLQRVGGREATEGQPVLAAADGRVMEADDDDGLGWHVFIDHGDGYTTVYGHMRDRPVVDEGTKVRQGQVLGFAGCTGRCTGDHIHFALWKDGASVPPEPLCGRSGFETGQLVESCAEPRDPLGGDFDGDGLPDAAFLARDATEARLDLFRGDGGSLAAPESWWRSDGASPSEVQLTLSGDFTGDKRSDAAALVGGPDCTLALLVFVAGDGKFEAPDTRGWWSTHAGCSDPVRDAAAGDFDGDGRADVALLYQHLDGETSIEILRSEGKRFEAEPAPRWQSETLTLMRASRLLAGDFDGDGLDDLSILFGPFDCRPQVRVLLAEGDAPLAGAQDWWRAPVCGPASIVNAAVADFDADGRDDVALLEQDGPTTRRIEVLRSDGQRFVAGETPWWQEEAAYPGTRLRGLAPGDFTGDGRADLALLLGEAPCKTKLVLLGSLGVAFLPGERWSSEDGCGDGVAIVVQ
ncbi:MAG: VCBS repeat domain-containing M23 family metallopeptidase [Dehalococcoidia bacterium]